MLHPASFIFAGGGTGGHLFPGLAIAERLVELAPGVTCHFLCSDRPIDRQILGRAELGGEPVSFEPLAAKPMALRPLALARFAASWGPSVRATRAAIRRLAGRGPVGVVSMGGFVAAPAVQGARAERVPVTLVNLDAVPGKANRWIARRADEIFSAVEPSVTPGRAPWQIVPPIVRERGRAGAPPAECRAAFGLDPSRPTLLVTGASQGAGSINRFMIAVARRHAGDLGGWQVIHQTGREGADEVRAAYEAAAIPALVHPFIDRMGLAWGAAELAVSRAGAGSVAEAWAAAVPAIFFPYPYHRDQHQRFNAAPLERAGGGVIVTDAIDPAANLRAAGPILLDLLRRPEKRGAMRRSLVGLGPADGADRIARALLSIPPANAAHPAR